MHVFPNGKRYVGITKHKDPQKRWLNGKGYTSNHQPLIARAIEKYGWDNIEHYILDSGLSEIRAKELEKYYITQKYKSNNKKYGYNITDGGDGVNGLSHSEETKKKISLKSKLMWNDESFKKDMAEKHKGVKNGNYGKHISEQQRKILSDYAKQRVGNKNHFYGKSHSEITKQQISKTKKSQCLTGSKNGNSKKVRCIELDKTFESASLAAKWVGASNSTITNACRHGSSFLSYGYHWEYVR